MSPAEIDYDALRFWLTAGQILVTLILGLVAWWLRQQAKTQTSITELEKRVVNTEQSINHMPTHSEMRDTYARIEHLHGDLKEISGKLTGLGRAVDMMNQYLIERGGGSS